MKATTFLAMMFFAWPLMLYAQQTDNDANSQFVKGADVGFLAAQERRGVIFHDRNGHERECLELLKNDYQISAIRIRCRQSDCGCG